MSGVKVQEKPRSIGRWYIGETLGKGGYSWVKKGYDKRTSKCVALKFMAKADASWEAEQTQQVITEIESLKKIRHPNVMKLYAYNLNAKYPTKEKTKIDSILLVLEFAPGGELFDILYYTSALEPIVARTYFRQFMAGLEACHSSGVAHRDLKPQNLLLDARFNLKITDFGLSKVFQSDSDTIMKTTYVGTRGYQSPELLLNRPYDLGCDIFSAGVVLFILLTGYPPFEQAHKNDRWFRPLAKGDYKKFWDMHHGCAISNDEDCKDLIQRMLSYDPKKRITITEIKKHKWYNGKFLEGRDLIKVLLNRHRQMEAKRRKDARKLKDLQTSIKRPIENLDEIAADVPFFPENEVEGIYDTHTTTHWKKVYHTIYDWVGTHGGGHADFDFDTLTLHCFLKITQKDEVSTEDNGLIKFFIQVFRSRTFIQEDVFSDDDDEEDQNKELVYVVRMKRVSGSVLDWKKILNVGLYKYCAGVLTGLPKWARRMARSRDVELWDETDEYDATLQAEGYDSDKN